MQEDEEEVNLQLSRSQGTGGQQGWRSQSLCGTPVETPGSMILAPKILGFDVAWGHFDIAWSKFWHKNGVFDQILGCSGHYDIA